MNLLEGIRTNEASNAMLREKIFLKCFLGVLLLQDHLSKEWFQPSKPHLTSERRKEVEEFGANASSEGVQ